MPEVGQQGAPVPSSSSEPEELAAAHTRPSGRQPAGELVRRSLRRPPSRRTATRSDERPRRRGQPHRTHRRGEAVTDGLDSRPGTQAPAAVAGPSAPGVGDALGLGSASTAASCSAASVGGLLVPAPRQHRAGRSCAREGPGVLRALARRHVLGGAQPERRRTAPAATSSSPGPRRGRPRRRARASTSRCTSSRAASRPCEGRRRRRAPRACRRGSSPCPGRPCGARPCPAAGRCRGRGCVAIAASERCETVAARIFASSPSDWSGWRRYSASVTTRPSTVSPRNSSRSLVGMPPASCANERCVRASTRSSGSRWTPSFSRRAGRRPHAVLRDGSGAGTSARACTARGTRQWASCSVRRASAY